MITPDNGNILVELQGEYKHIRVTEQKYDTKTQGICVAVDDPKHKKWLGKKVLFKSYEDDTDLGRDGKKYALIDGKVVKGHEDVEA